jgi:Flp pilus assembly protein TadG
MPLLTQFGRDRAGAVLPLVAAGATMLFGMGALTIDFGRAYSTQNTLQTAADAAVLAAVREIADPARARQVAERVVEAYFPEASYGDVLSADGLAIGVWNPASRSLTTDAAAPNALHITLRRTVANGNPEPLQFAKVLGFATLDLEAEAVAVLGSAPVGCLIALHPTAEKALLLSGGSDIESPDCGVQVNSTHPKAMEVSGGGHVEASEICVGGNANLSGGSTTSPAVTPNCATRPDPFAGITPPGYGGCTYNSVKIGGGSHTFSPGVYCGGIEMSSGVTATFLPGHYVIRNGPLKSSGGGSITGDQVVFHLTGSGALVDVSGGGSVHLTAPRSGPLTGFVFYQDPYATPGLKNKISGGGSLYYEGTVYFPDQHVEWSGGSIGTSPPWTMFVARTFLISGGGALRIRADYSDSSVPVPLGVAAGRTRLVR